MAELGSKPMDATLKGMLCPHAGYLGGGNPGPGAYDLLCVAKGTQLFLRRKNLPHT